MAVQSFPEKAYWITLNKVNGIGAVRFAALIERCGSAEAAWNAPIRTLQEAGLDRRSLENLLVARRQLNPGDEWERFQKSGFTAFTLDEATYPANLRQMDAPPPLLFVRGEIVDSDELAVALVGTRRASSYGREVAHTVATDLAHANVTVVSGLALGIDTIAHRAAIDAGGRTIAVLGSGVDQIYPPQNHQLALEIERNGALVSEYPLGTRPIAANFPPRNRIISGLSRSVAIIEASQQSGALITADFALEQGRDLFAVPGSILHPGSIGCNELIRNGAIPLLSARDLLEQLDVIRVAEQQAVRRTVPTDPFEANLLSFLSIEPLHIDELVRRSAMPAPQVTGLLAMMELKGMVRQVGSMNYVKS